MTPATITRRGALAGRGGSFLPSSLPTLKLWWKVDALSQADNTFIAQLVDQSGSGNHGNPYNSPRFWNNQQNGLPAVRINGAGDAFSAGANPLGSATAGTMVVVCRVDAENSSRATPWKMTGATGSLYQWAGDGFIYEHWGSTSRPQTFDPPTSLAAWHVYSVVSAANDYRHYLNGVLRKTVVTNTVSFGSQADFGLGGDGGNTGHFLGWAGETCLFNAALSDADRSAVEGYLKAKWGTP